MRKGLFAGAFLAAAFAASAAWAAAQDFTIHNHTGHVIVTRFVSAHDSGRVVNPLTAQSQVQGGAIQGIGMALHEELLYDKRSGQPLNAGFHVGIRRAFHQQA